MKYLPLNLLAIFFLLCACQVAPAPTQPAQTAIPASTVQKTQTPLPTATTTATPSPDSTETRGAVLDENGLIAAVTSAVQPEVIQDYPTADGKFRVQVIRYECTQIESSGDRLAYEQLLVTAADGDQVPVAQQLQNCGGLGAFGFNGHFWTTDNRYFYFDESREGIPDGASCGLWLPGLSRVDTDTMVVERLPGSGSSTPDGSVMVLWAEPDFVLWNPQGSEIARTALALDTFHLISFEIAPGGDRLIYLLRDECFSPEAKTIVGLLDLHTMTSSTILESPPNGHVHVAWQSEDTAVLMNPAGSTFLLNISTGEIEPQE